MYATIRRYEGVDKTRIDELTKKLNEVLTPRLSKLPGFAGFYVIQAGDGILSSFGLFEDAVQADESTRVAAAWVRDQKLEKVLPGSPKITSGHVIAHQNGTVTVA